MKKILFLMLMLFINVSAQEQFNKFLGYVFSLPSADRQVAVDSFYTYAKSEGIPFIEQDTNVVFLYKGSASSVYIAGDFNGWDYERGRASKIESTNLFYLKRTFEADARLDYKIVLNGNNWILDPANPNTVWGGFGPNSELAMPAYIQPWEIEYNPSISHGRKITTNLTSDNVGKTFKVFVYLPAEYNSNPEKSYPVVYFQDGEEYIELASAINVLDNLTATDSIAPVIGVFVKPNNRNDEYAFNLRNNYVKFFAEELVPYIDENYRTIKNPEFRAVIGDSYGGNISALIAFKHSELFGNCGLHSGAFQPNNYEAYNYWVNSEKLPVRFYSVWGTYEGLHERMRSFRDILKQKGYEFNWKEFHEGHSWGLWRATIDLFLMDFFPPDLTGVENVRKKKADKIILQNYPNPVSQNENTSVSIIYSVPNLGTPGDARSYSVQLKVYDVLGKTLTTLVNKSLTPGLYEAKIRTDNIAAGIYFYSLMINNGSESLKRTNKILLVK